MVTLAATAWALSTNPFAAPWIERSAQDLALTLERRVRLTATSDWIGTELAEAVASEDAERAEMLLGLADDLGRDINREAAEALIAARSGWTAQAADCAACMADTAACRSAAQLTACAVPFELSPLGDLNALRRAGVAYAGGEPVDQIDAGLALVGLGATGALLASGGSSGAVKLGTGLLRMARRMGAVTPALARRMDLPVAWSRVPDLATGPARLEDVTDTARLAELTDIATDMGRVRDATTTGEALRLARLVDGPDDAARLARIAEAMGPRTTRTLEVLGKSRAFRATLRLGRAAAAALALIWLSVLQLLTLLASRAGARALRAFVAP